MIIIEKKGNAAPAFYYPHSWKKLTCLLTLCLCMGMSHVFAQIPNIYFELRNEKRTGLTYEFDVFMFCDMPNTYHNKGQVYILYDTAAFGQSIVLNGKVTPTRLDLLDDTLTLLNAPLYNVVYNDNVNRLVATWFSNFQNNCPPSGVFHTLVDTVPIGLLNFSIQMKDSTVNPDLRFDYGLMRNQQFYSDPNPPIANQNCDLPYGNAGLRVCNLAVDLGPDTLVCADNYLLDASYPNANYLWFGGSMDSVLLVDSTDNYWVRIDSGGCIAFDTISVRFSPQAKPMITASPGTNFCTIDTITLSVSPFFSAYNWSSGDTTATIKLTSQGVYYLDVIDTVGCTQSDSIDLRVAAQDTQYISLRKDWNLISSYLCQRDETLDSIFNGIISTVWILKDGTGQAYIPSMVNTIGQWERKEGYQIKLYRDTVIAMVGERLAAAQNNINLAAGWNLIAYLRDSALAVTPALGPGVLSNLYVLKDQDGLVFVPSFGIDQIGNMDPGQGYWIRMIAPDTLVYPARTGYYAQDWSPAPALRHFNEPTKTAESATLIFPMENWQHILAPGDEIAAYLPDGTLVGSAVYDQKSFAMAVWGDEASTEVQDGMNVGESYQLTWWHASTGLEEAIDINILSGETNYQTNGISVIAARGVQAPTFEPIRWFPNPASDKVHIDCMFELDQQITIELYDLSGKQIYTDEQNVAAGHDRLNIPTASFARGVYLWRMKWEGGSSRGKLILE